MVDCLHKRIENPKTENINAQDTESGYTAMHHCLYHGKLLNALELLKLQPDLGIRDREGNTCLDVFYATIPKLESDNLPHVSVWTWGSNSNFLLGDSRDNRTLPDQLNLVTDKREPRIEDLKMSKYHACLISDHRLYVWGFGQGGRLGLGHETTITIPTRVKISGQVQFVALGPDNTLVITDHGRLWSFGSNEFQQLGYPLDKDKQLVPNEISIKKVQFKACAISKYHACAITYTGSVYTWGTNHGQLGYQQPVQVSPRKVTSFPQQDLLSISCTNTATCVLTQTHEVHVFSNDCLKRIQFPKFSTKTLGQKELPIKIVSGNHQFGCLMSTGDVYMWSPPEKQYQDTWQQQYFPQSKPRRVWSVKKKY
ncbi:regulator of chromosome condensation 1/beta-lactamase-inhibitor protein II, partial [Gorgonomyces haynaldii]